MKAIWPLTALLLLAACGDKNDDEAAAPVDGSVNETVMDNVDDLEGTISDDMIAIEDLRSQSATGPDGLATGEMGAAGSGPDLSADGSPPADTRSGEEQPGDEIDTD